MKPILVDIDNTIADFTSGYYEMANRYKYRVLNSVLPEKSTLQTFYIHHGIDSRLLTSEIEQQCHDIVNEVGLFVNLKPIKGAIEGVNRLKEMSGRDVFFVSAPHNSAKMSYTEKALWIENNFGSNWLDNLILTRDKTVIDGIILIDDKPEPMGKFIPKWEHIVFDQPYNRLNTKGKRRMFSWEPDQVDSLVKYLEGKE